MGVRGVSAAGRTPGPYALVAYPPLRGLPGGTIPGTPYPLLVGGSTPLAGAVDTAPTRTPTTGLDSTRVGPIHPWRRIILEVFPAAISGWGAWRRGRVRVPPLALTHAAHRRQWRPRGTATPTMRERWWGAHSPRGSIRCEVAGTPYRADIGPARGTGKSRLPPLGKIEL